MAQQEISNLPGFYWINKKNIFGVETKTRRAYNPSTGENITVREAQTRQHGGVSYEQRKKGVVGQAVDKIKEVFTGRKKYTPSDIEGFVKANPKSLTPYQKSLRNEQTRLTAQERFAVAKKMGIDVSRETGVKPDRVEKIASGTKYRGFKSDEASKIASIFDDRPIRPSEVASYVGTTQNKVPEAYRGKAVDLTTMRYVPGVGLVAKHGSLTLHMIKLTSTETGQSRYKFYSSQGLRSIIDAQQGDGVYDFMDHVEIQEVA